MALEVLLFRSLFRNSKASMIRGPRLVYQGDKWLWAAALAFHWAFFFILVRHLRFFLEPVPAWVNAVASVDAFLQVGLPAIYATDVLILLALGFLLIRRFTNPQVRAISIAPDYFPLFLILALVVTGVLLRYVTRVDVAGVKVLATNLVAFRFAAPEGLGVLPYVHVFLLCVLLAYFPFSKLLHAPGVFLSPTRNQANSNRTVRHENPWNRDVSPHKFEDWEKEFADEIAQAGYKLERD